MLQTKGPTQVRLKLIQQAPQIHSSVVGAYPDSHNLVIDARNSSDKRPQGGRICQKKAANLLLMMNI
jgi:hypothetical protein